MKIIFFWSIILINGEKLGYPGRNEKLKSVIRNDWEMYYKCLESENVNEIRMRYVLPGQTIRLECTPCRQPFDSQSIYTWKQRAVNLNSSVTEYEFLSEAFMLSGLNELMIRNARVEYTGIYQCFRGTGYVSTYIVEIPEQIVLRLVDSSEPLQIQVDNSTQLQIEWSEWSSCSKCDTVGKRFKYGICVLKTSKHIYKKISCFSRFLDNNTENLIKTNGVTNFAIVELCKDSCKTNEENRIENFKTGLQREIISAPTNTFLTLQCPGITGKTIPITWKVLMMEIVPEIIKKQTNDRIVIDLVNRLEFQETKPQDANIYSCWQQNKLIGTIHLDITKPPEKNGQTLAGITALAIIILAVYIGLKALHRKK